jgi:hypothetical protein
VKYAQFLIAVSLMLTLGSSLAGQPKVTCGQAAKLERDVFVEKYLSQFATTETTKTTLPTRAALSFWTDCKHKQTMSGLKNYPRIKKTITTLRSAELALLNNVFLAQLELGQIGSMYLDFSPLAASDIEIHIARVVALLKTSAGGHSNSKIVKMQTELEKKIAQAVSELKTSAKGSKALVKAVSEISRALSIIRGICGPSKNNVNVEIYSQVFDFFQYKS